MTDDESIKNKEKILRIAKKGRLEVGECYASISEKKRKKVLRYTDILKDKNGYVDSKYFLPIKFDLVELKGERRVYRGWWNGRRWEGLRVPAYAKITHWKRISEY